MGKGTIVRTAVITLTILAGLIGTVGHSLASFDPDQKLSKGTFAIDALVTHATVKRGDEEEVELATVPQATVLITVKYPTKGGFHTKGKTDKTGYWQHKWQIHADYAGAAAAVLEITKNNQRRYYTVHFTVASSSTTTATVTVPTTATSVSTVTVTPTPTGSVSIIPGTTTTVTTTATTTPTPTDTPTDTPTPTVTATPTATATPTSTSAPYTGTALPFSFETTDSGQNPQSNFNPATDSAVYTYVFFDPNSISGNPAITFDWYGPNGTKVATTSGSTPTSTNPFSQSDLPLTNVLSGTWYVQLVLNGIPEAEARFYVTSSPQSTDSTGATVSSASLYPSYGAGAPPTGVSPLTTFSASTTAAVYAYANVSWDGTGSVTFTWTSPDQQVYETYIYQSTDTGSATVMSSLPLSGQPAASDTGSWTVEIQGDNGDVTVPFTVTS